MLQGRQLAFEDRVLKEFQVRPPPPPRKKRQNIFLSLARGDRA